MSDWVCTQHGALDDAPGARCPHCQDEAYDVTKPEDREFVELWVSKRRSRRAMTAFGLAMIPGFLLSYGVGLYLDNFLIANDLVAITLILVFSLPARKLLELRLSEAQLAIEERFSEPARRFRWRRFTGVPVISALVISAFSVLVFLTDFEPQPLALRAERILQVQELHTLVTHALVHVDLPHLVGNLLGLLLFGVAVDLRVGRSWCLLLLITTIASQRDSDMLPCQLTHQKSRDCAAIRKGLIVMPDEFLKQIHRLRFDRESDVVSIQIVCDLFCIR